METGTVLELTVDRETPLGYMLTDGEETILLHRNEATRELAEDETVEVFLYSDQKSRITATMTIPKGLNGHEWVEVVEVLPGLGAFVHIGIAKDALIPSDDLPVFEDIWPQVGDQLLCRVKTDRRGKLIGKLATQDVMLDRSIKAPSNLLNNNIQGTIYRLLKVGSYMITNEGYVGFIHHSERKEEPRLGKVVEGRVIDVKEDGTINVSLMPRKQDAMDDDSKIIMEYLEARGGAMPYSDKSAPEDILERFQISKGAFKRAMGKLMKDGLVTQSEGWTYKKKEE
ncbi:S1 RNA-binding domain-containing protein [Bacillus sp. THAF10]|uniref:CvfB family protein n=1 Tax=Bacillus sp. THAF10 TaxID=2587848 RepID=UPI00126956AD|nr:S1-like domain-containing RNA-binding protein [Bacillus sp. THAF10]